MGDENPPGTQRKQDTLERVCHGRLTTFLACLAYHAGIMRQPYRAQCRLMVSHMTVEMARIIGVLPTMPGAEDPQPSVTRPEQRRKAQW
ncbi:hypothetical protein BOX17_14890 [Halomonas aestuarii]|uniref:Uncharacterized protein n=1 Tax=Halomonas aestuarii TaxID=1897729 RepID=A0A1J0VJC1_9GAMM|nr:hypothetical protein BOX17_14890 [Halomonas aestuarii]